MTKKVKQPKKYCLHNSYFKLNRMNNLPDAIPEIAQYEKANGELPFAYTGSNWVYDAFCERQKYRGVHNAQFLTPDDTANRMTWYAGKYFTGKNVLEPCCGTGQITKELLKEGYDVAAFDNDNQLVRFCALLYPDLMVFPSDFKDYNCHVRQIIANPPYEIAVLTDFLEWMNSVQVCGGMSVLLLPRDFIKKTNPKRTFQALQKFELLECEDMHEEFVRTKIRAEIVVLRKL